MSKFFSGPTAAVLAITAVLLCGCSASKAQERDLSQGGTCAAGEDIVISAEGATPVIEGDCGRVRIEAANISGNIAGASAVEINAENVTLLGAAWGQVQVGGKNVTLNVDKVDSLASRGDGFHLTNHELGDIVLEADSATINSDSLKSLIVKGSSSTVVVNEITEVFEVHGDSNTINWDSGLEKPSVDSGTNNTYSF